MRATATVTFVLKEIKEQILKRAATPSKQTVLSFRARNEHGKCIILQL